MALLDTIYNEHFRLLVLSAVARDGEAGSRLVRAGLNYARRGVVEREAAERALKELYACDGRPHHAHAIKHWLAENGAQGAEVREIA